MKYWPTVWFLSFSWAVAQESTVAPVPPSPLAATSATVATTASLATSISPTTAAVEATVESIVTAAATSRAATTSSSSASSAASPAASEESTEKEQARLAAEQEWVNFKAIQKVLNNDQLAAPAQRQQQAMQKSKQRQQNLAKARFDIPTADNFWGSFSEFWLVKNINLLQWDVAMPDYGIEGHFVQWLKKLKIPPLKFKLLLLDSINICHVALPSDPGEVIFLLSVPFIRTLDLSQTEISLILLEDFVRLQQGYLQDYITPKDARRFWGTNFRNNQKFQGRFIGEMLQRLDELTMGTGFNFQQQFVVTSALKELIQNDEKLNYTYPVLLKKIDHLVKSDPKYKNYLSIYPSPELQLNWLQPDKVKNIE